MIRRTHLLCSGWLVLGSMAVVPAAVDAQHRSGTVEAGAFVQVNRFDNSYEFENATGGGARVGVFLRPKLSLELSASYAETRDTAGQSISYVPISVFAMFHLPIRDNLDVLLGPGYVHARYGEGISVSTDGFSALAGLRIMMTQRLGIRVDGRADVYSQSPIGTSQSINWSLTAGLSFFMGKTARRDTDRDGVEDAQDRCPSTPSGTLVDATGCAFPADSDLDGVLDPLDRCPDTPRGERIDQNGCPLDSDNDGVFDDRDRCRDTPAGDRVDVDGCTIIPDTDGDGILDDRDRCPDTPRGTSVDEVGCPLPPIPICRVVARFPLNLATLSDSARTHLTHLADSLARFPDHRFAVEGHADITGPAVFNQWISQQRADSVRAFLVSRGVEAGRLQAMGFSSDRPIAANDTREGRALNRRVELRRID